MRSHLLTQMTIARPPSCAYPAMVASSASTPSVASSTTTVTSAMRMWRRAITTLSFSVISLVLPLRRMPAVSTNTYSISLWITASSTESRVVPATGDTMDRSSPVRVFSSVDFPVFGRPIIATLILRISTGSVSCGSSVGKPDTT